MSTRENIRLIARSPLSSWCHMMVEQLFLMVQWGCLRFVILGFPDHTHYFVRPLIDVRFLFLLNIL